MPRFLSALSPNALGVVAMLVGMLFFSLNDAVGKWLLTSYSVGQLILVRSLAAIVLLALFMTATRAPSPLKVTRPGLHVFRVALSTFEIFAFYIAVRNLPLADVMTIWLAAPIYVAALSPWLLKESVGWRRWIAIGIGFVGVIITLEPSSATFSPATLISLVGTMAFALLIVLGRTLRATPDSTLVFWQMLGTLAAGAVAAPFVWTPITSFRDLFLLCLLGLVAMLAHVLVNRSLKLADAATVAPLQYSLLVWAILFGWLFFGDMPRPMMLLGAVLIIASGLFIFFREQRAKGRVVADQMDMP